MKKTIKLAVVAALALGTTSAFATNGSNLLGLGAKARGMGGTTIGVSHGAESGLANGALITTIKNTEISFGGTLFMPDVSNTNNLVLGAPPAPDLTSSANSDADMSVIPEVSIATKITDNFYAGIGMWGTAGMGVDYRDAANTGQMSMVTNLQLMQFGVPLAYKVSDFSLSVTPVLQYGSLDLQYDATNLGAAPVGAGVSQDLSFGFNLGAAYEIAGITLGAVYKSQIDMEYKGQLTTAMQGFGLPYTNDTLSTPAEIGIGASYKMDEHSIAIDYKQIAWSDAEGYKDFAWEDQDVVSIGYEYATKSWAARLGYNYASNPIVEQAIVMGTLPSGGSFGGLINTFNLLGFPATTESHITMGGTYSIDEKTSVDLALAYAPEVSETFKNFMGQDITTKHSQTSVSFGLNYAF